MKVVRLLIYSLAMAALLYITNILLPVTWNLNEMISRGLFILILMVFLKVSKDKWLFKIGSIGLGLIVFMVLMVYLPQ